MSSGNVHHHGPLAGLGAGAAGVIAGVVFVFAVWRHVAGQMSAAVQVIVWAFTAAVVAAVAAGMVWAFLFLRHRVLHPEVLARPVIRAEVLGPAPTAVREIPAAEPVAELTAGPLWRLNPRAMHADPVPDPQERGHE